MSAAATGVKPTHSITEEVRNSWFGTLNYSYAEKYFVDLSIRRDGSSLFGENNRWATFGAAAAMWKISREKFMEGTKSLRVTIGYSLRGLNVGLKPNKNNSYDVYLADFLLGNLDMDSYCFTPFE